MADAIVIAGVKPYDGEYVFDTDERAFTILEWRWIKKIAGYMPMTISDGWSGRDPDLILVFAVIALARAGKIDKEQAYLVADRLVNTEFDGVSIQLIAGEAPPDEDDDADPPSVASPTSPATPSTGTSGKPTSESSDSLPEPIGVPV